MPGTVDGGSLLVSFQTQVYMVNFLTHVGTHSYMHTPVHLEICWRLAAELKAGSSQSSMNTQFM